MLAWKTLWFHHQGQVRIPQEMVCEPDLLHQRNRHQLRRSAGLQHPGWKQRFPELVETEPELLAHHLTEAGLKEEALLMWEKAAISQ